MKTTNTIFYVSAPCGAGKTYAVCKIIGEDFGENKLSNTLIISPSMTLVEQTEKQLKAFGVTPVVITSNTTSTVISDAVKFFKDVILDGQVVLMTHAGFKRTPFFSNKESWNLFVDEIPSVDIFHDPLIPYNHKNLSDYLDIKTLNGKVNEVSIKADKYNAAKKLLEKSDDNINNIVKPVLRDLIEGRKVFADTKSYGKIVENQNISKDSLADTTYGNAKNRLYFLSMLTPAVFKGWRSTTILGANFENSMLAKYWNEQHRVIFEPAKNIYSHLRYEEHDIGHRLSIRYIQNDAWSKYQRDQKPNETCDFVSYGNAIDAYVENEVFKGERYVYVANTDYINNNLKNAIRMPVMSHGLNTYQDHTNVYYSPALNRQPKHMQMLEAIGFDNGFIQRATSHEVVYQAIMRCALRNPTDDSQVNVVVPDRASCEALARLFPGCSLGELDCGELKRTKPPAKSPSERKRKGRFKSYLEQMELMKRVQFSYIDESCTEDINFYNDVKSMTEVTNDNNIRMSFFPNIQSTSGITDVITDLIKFRRELKGIFSSNVYGDGDNIKTATGKNDNFLCSPALFNPNKSSDTSRGLDNVEYTSFLALDFDDGDLTPEKFIRIFWTDAVRGQKLTFDIMNSAGHDPEHGINKFRVFMYYATTATVEEHYAIFDNIKARIASKGYLSFINPKQKNRYLQDRGIKSIKESGLDLSKRPPSSLFYLPGKLKGKEDSAFFKSYGNDTKRLKSLLIDPVTIYKLQKQCTELVPIEYELPEPVKLIEPIAKVVAAMESSSYESNKGQRLADCLQEYNMILVGTGQRYAGLFTLASQLNYLKLDTVEIEQHLTTAAHGDKKILSRIKGVLKNIKKQHSTS